ncbi:polysaccharide biosynthesis/export family protein [Rhizobium halophytocola]|uniref:Exopolysaccharide production protein ExoF n=1 Tax=Rhizobium halophytocola TaxID=735519 RepID=A0ABS4E4V0_9HYPH|nr:polysaccharide biosynthesis/export family protein [Rhizobium halophytocola]MBP1852947.1 exopolysaccharide production protein ExoF [Rhizobium halophytocola]
MDKNHARRWRRKAAFGLIAGSLTVLTAATALAQDAGYRLDVMDKLKIRVAEWQPADGTIHSMDGIAGDYTIGPEGTIFLPFIGDIKAAGRSPSDISKEIGERLQSQFALRTTPSASVEVAEFGPIYLAGDIQTPGQYPFAPNLTVLKAVSLAGGLRRADAGQRFARDFINASGDTAVNQAEYARLLARRARLLAEINDKTEIKIPPGLEKVANAKTLLASEQALMQSRRESYELRLKALGDLKELLNSEVQSLNQKEATQQSQLKLVKEDRARIDRLTEKGLMTSSRQLTSAERSANVESTLLDIDTATLRAKQDISQADQDEITLRNNWKADRTKELQDTEAQIEKIELELSTNHQLMSEALAQSAEAAKFDPSGKPTSVKYTIVRDDGDGAKEIPVDETVKLEPGDVVKVMSQLLME